MKKRETNKETMWEQRYRKRTNGFSQPRSVLEKMKHTHPHPYTYTPTPRTNKQKKKEKVKVKTFLELAMTSKEFSKLK